jgi:hypothetical protein
MEGEECFHCVGPASERYTLVLETGKVVKDKWLCDECVSAFREEDWMEIHETPVLLRGGDDPAQDDQSGE